MVCLFCSGFLIYLNTHSLNPSFTYIFSYLLTYAHIFTCLFICLLTYLFTYLFIYLLAHSHLHIWMDENSLLYNRAWFINKYYTLTASQKIQVNWNNVLTYLLIRLFTCLLSYFLLSYIITYSHTCRLFLILLWITEYSYNNLYDVLYNRLNIIKNRLSLTIVSIIPSVTSIIHERLLSISGEWQVFR